MLNLFLELPKWVDYPLIISSHIVSIQKEVQVVAMLFLVAFSGFITVAVAQFLPGNLMHNRYGNAIDHFILSTNAACRFEFFTMSVQFFPNPLHIKAAQSEKLHMVASELRDVGLAVIAVICHDQRMFEIKKT